MKQKEEEQVDKQREDNTQIKMKFGEREGDGEAAEFHKQVE